MGIMKDIYMDAYERLWAEAEESGLSVDESKLGEKAYEAMIDRMASMADAAKDKWKESGQ
jgi:hypothetical protein